MMTNGVDNPTSIQLFFDGKTGDLLLFAFPGHGEYGQNVTLTGSLPPDFIVTAAVDGSVGNGKSVANCSFISLSKARQQQQGTVPLARA